VLIPDITSGGGLANFAATSSAQGGDLVNVKPALDLITSIKGVKFWRRAEQAVTQFQTGDISAVIYAGWCVLKQGWIGIVSGTKNPAAVAAYINQFLAEDFQFEFAKVNGLVAVNRHAQAKMAQDPVLKEMLILDPAQMNKMLKVDYSKANISNWIDQWHRTIAR